MAKNGETEKLEAVLFTTLETLRICAIILQPIVPQLSEQLLDKLTVGRDQRMWSDAMMLRWKDGERDLCAETSAILFQRIRLETEEKQKHGRKKG